MDSAPRVRFARLPGGERLAYSQAGSGPVLVCPAWWVSHLEHDWEEEGFRLLFGALAAHFTVVRYDRPGVGLSEQTARAGENDGAGAAALPAPRINLETEVAVLAGLIDHLELETVSLLAVSCAGPTSITYAARNPGRIERLIFCGSFVRGADVGTAEVKTAIQGLVRAHWGMGSRAITNLLAPDLAEEEVKRLSRRQRAAASPELAADLLSLTFDVDASKDAAAVDAPALVLHREGDRTVPHAAGRELAAALPDAVFATLPGNEHVPWMGDVAAVVREVLEFFGVAATAAPPVAREQPANALVRSGDVWTLTFAGRSAHLKHARGLDDLAILLTRPGIEVHVGTLWSGAATVAVLGGSDPVLDQEALASYRARFDELESAIAEAEAAGRPETVEDHRIERDLLAAELRAAVGLGGRQRALVDPSERARKAVSARIRASIKKISEVHPDLGAHLESAISTGIYCSYSPESEIRWSFDYRR